MESSAGDYFKTHCPHCSRSVFVTRKDLEKGVPCIHCQQEIIDPDQKRQKEEAEELLREIEDREEQNTDPSIRRFACPNCGVMIEVSYPQKILAQCNSCHMMALRDEKLVIPSGDDTDAVVRTPSEDQLEQLKRFNVSTIPETANAAYTIIRIIKEKIEKSLKLHLPAYKYLPLSQKRRILEAISDSPLFPRIYFGDIDAAIEEISPFIHQVFEDEELRNALTLEIPVDKFKAARAYCNEFCQYALNVILDRDQPEILSLKAFARGFGRRLQPLSSTIYDLSGAQTKIEPTMNDERNYEFYNRRSEVNELLFKLLLESGITRRDMAYASMPAAGGCLLVVLLGTILPFLVLFTAGAIYKVI